MFDPQNKKLIALCGIVGPIFLLLYFGVPALFPNLAKLLYGGAPTVEQIVHIGTQYHALLSFGAWLQGIGALLSVIFFIGLVRLVKGSGALAADVVLLGSAILVAVVVGEMVFTLTWVNAAVSQQAAVAQTSYNLMSRFIQVFPIVPAPTVYLGLAVAMSRKHTILPSVYGRLAFALGLGFIIVGLAGVFTPLAAAGSAALAGLQSIWVLTAAATLIRIRLTTEAV